jgi:hypothetical protein
MTFGEYLRGLIAADYDMFPVDERGYRIAFIEAFRRRATYPIGTRTLSVDNPTSPTLLRTCITPVTRRNPIVTRGADSGGNWWMRSADFQGGFDGGGQWWKPFDGFWFSLPRFESRPGN